MKFSCLMVISKEDKNKFLYHSIKSISKNQIHKADEYVIIKNGKLNQSTEKIIEDFRNEKFKVKIIKLNRQKILSTALNIGLKYCSFSVVARMDPDDMSMPDRFKNQIDFLKKNPKIDILGSWAREFSSVESIFQIKKLPIHHEKIIKYAKLRCPIVHPSVIFRKKKIIDIGSYPSLSKGQDYLLWSRCIKAGYKFHNIPKCLILFRVDLNFLNRRGLNHFSNELIMLNLMKYESFINTYEYIISVFIRFIIRSMPNTIKFFLYKYKNAF